MKLLEPIQVGKMTLKNRIMFPPLTTGYEERDGSIGQRSLSFYERLAKGGVSYVVIGDVAPVRTASPTPKLYNDEQIRRHEVLPGLTGWAQINGRNSITWSEKFKLDVWYVDNWSLWLDIKIFFLTFWKVVKREGINQSESVTMEYFNGSN